MTVAIPWGAKRLRILERHDGFYVQRRLFWIWWTIPRYSLGLPVGSSWGTQADALAYIAAHEVPKQVRPRVVWTTADPLPEITVKAPPNQGTGGCRP